MSADIANRYARKQRAMGVQRRLEAEALAAMRADERAAEQRRQRREAYGEITSARRQGGRDDDATPPAQTDARRGLAERAGTGPVNSDTASKLQRIVHSGDEADKAIIERVMLEIGYERGAAGFTPNDVRPYLRIDGVWEVNRYLVSGMYSTSCSEGLAEAIDSTRIHDPRRGNEGTACNRYRLMVQGSSIRPDLLRTG